MGFLIIDSSAEAYEKLQKPLENEFNQAIQICLSGESALDWIRTAPEEVQDLEVIFLAVKTQGLSAQETYTRLKALPEIEDIPILVLSPADDAEVNLLLDSGVFDFIVDPPNLTDLKARVRAALRYFKVQKKLKSQASELAAAQLHLQNFTGLDPLTHLSKRLTFEQTLTREWRRAMREQQFLSLLLIDMDFFQRLNQDFGSAIGDRCLKAVGDILSKYPLRPGDMSARYSGQQFAVLLPNTHLEGARAVAEKIRTDVENLKLEHEKVSIPLTISIGSATYYVQDDTLEPFVLLEAADKALLDAKSQGRNIVSLLDLTKV
jgi:two-component system, chemotaxis family, response regulator WspR